MIAEEREWQTLFNEDLNISCFPCSNSNLGAFQSKPVLPTQTIFSQIKLILHYCPLRINLFISLVFSQNIWLIYTKMAIFYKSGYFLNQRVGNTELEAAPHFVKDVRIPN